MTRNVRSLFLLSTAISGLTPQVLYAQSTHPATASASSDATTGDGELVVTARRRDETSLAVPVAVTAVSGASLQRQAINTVDSLARIVPTLITSEATSSPQGGIVAIRGLSGVDANPFGDQAVSFNIDGVPVARSSVRRLAQMDIAQVEVLKGPQALFFGKNSPAGIISMRTADPTAALAFGLTSGYEFAADEFRNEGYVSGPLTDTLGLRVAAYDSTMKGYVQNVAPESGANVLVPFDRRAPNGNEFAIRGTLKWKPSADFSARLKVSYNKSDGSGSTDILQFLNCPLGRPQGTPTGFATPENCKPDNKVTATDNIGNNFRNVDSRFGNETYLRSSQLLAGLEMDYNLSDSLTLSSISGFYRSKNGYVGSFTANFAENGIPQTFLPAFAALTIRELTQEIRLTSQFAGPLNFMIGGLAQDVHGDDSAVVYFNANSPTFSSNYLYELEGSSLSIFGQVSYEIVSRLELSGGARYSHEKKSLPVFRAARGVAPTTLLDVTAPRDVSFDNVSPEATLRYRPTDNLTLYASYKEGFLSGGFNATQPALSPTVNAAGGYTSLVDPRYGQQTTSGFEGGIKASLFDGTLRTNLAVYDYTTDGLQVSVLVGLNQELRNAGKVKTRGVEFDFNYRTPVNGLNLFGALSYENGKYADYQATCYRGLPAPECRVQVNRYTGVAGLLHDISGTQLARAPDWSGNLGFDYVSGEFSGMKLGLQSTFSFSDSFFTDVVSGPGGRQKPYQLLDAGVRLISADDRWEVALLGRNLTNTYYFTRSADNPFSGSAPGGVGTTLGDTVGVVNRGREVWLRATFRYGG